MPGFQLRLESTSPAGRISTVSVIDAATEARPSRTTVRGGIPPRTQQVAIYAADTFPVLLNVYAGIDLGAGVVWGPADAATGMNGRTFRPYWTEGPAVTPPPVASFASSQQVISLHPWHVGCWRFAMRLTDGAGVDNGAVVIPFFVKQVG